ncbi:MAG: hypothetical protein O7A08_03270 [SAR324 cluster bacterium]|nr:hypothetical protein [SAR324 cluster bacterium]
MVLLLMLTGLLTLPGPARAEPVAGEACYAYGPGETLVAAKHIAISLAKRKALEGYRPYMEATANMRDPQLRNELIANLTVRSMKSIKVVRVEENKKDRKVCGAIEAEVEPVQMQEQVSAVFYAFNNRKQFLDTGLPESAQLRIIRIQEFPCSFDKEVQCLNLIAECRVNTFGERHPIRIIWYDPEGRPAFTINRRISCERARDVENILLRLPPGAYTFEVDLP